MQVKLAKLKREEFERICIFIFVSFMPYATGIVSSHFMNHTAQLFYGLIVIVSTVASWFLHKVIDKPNIDQKELLEATAQYRKLLIPDLIIKGVGLILSLILYPPIMMYSVFNCGILHHNFKNTI